MFFSRQQLSDYQSFDSTVGFTDGSVWDVQSPDCIHCQIEWRVKLNNGVVVKNTKQDFNQLSRYYWEQTKKDICNILERKTVRSQRVRLDNTDIVLTVNSQRNIDKKF